MSITYLEKVAKEEAKIREHQRKQQAIEQERKERMNEVGQKANQIRNLTILKSCFEVCN